MVSNIVNVVDGIYSNSFDTFLRKRNRNIELCFTIVLLDRTLDLEALNGEEKAIFLCGLKFIIQNRNSIENQ